MKIERLLAIVSVLMQKDITTAPELAEKLEVSRRTINRDIETLCRAGIPVITQQGYGGGISIPRSYKLNAGVLTRAELKEVLSGLQGINSVSPDTAKLIYKLAPENNMPADQPMIINLASYYSNTLPQKIELLRRAVEERKIVMFDYYARDYARGGAKRRRIEPYYIVFQWSAWYVLGFCTESNVFRLFKLNRLWELEATEQVYKLRPVPMSKLDVETYFLNRRPIAALFDESVEWALVEEYGPDSYTRTGDGRLLFEWGYENEDYAIQWIMGLGDKAEVIAPQELREKIARRVSAMSDIYSREPELLL